MVRLSPHEGSAGRTFLFFGSNAVALVYTVNKLLSNELATLLK